MKYKNPSLKLKYAKGLGDLLACFLHSKPIGWFVHLLTGQDEPCSTCSQRAMALNILFPIPVWKLFFKNSEELEISFLNDLKKVGYQTTANNENDEKVFIKNEVNQISEKNIQKELNTQLEKQLANIQIDEKIISSNKTEIGDYIVQVNIFKR